MGRLHQLYREERSGESHADILTVVAAGVRGGGSGANLDDDKTNWVSANIILLRSWR